MRTKRPLDPLLRLIRHAWRVALVCHVMPDGDTLGSALALKQGLRQRGCEAEVFCQNPLPESLQLLPGTECLRQPESLAEAERFDLLICIDISDVSRMGSCRELFARADHTAQLDHHGTNTNFCDVNCVDGTAPACALLVHELLRRLHLTITPEMALCLAAALSTDTAHLAYSNTTPEAYRVMAELVEAGAPIGKLYRKLYRERPPRQVALLTRALESLTYHHDGQITSMHLTRRDFAECGAVQEDAEIIANYGMDIRGVRMSAFLRENEQGSVTMSFRSTAPWQVSGVARRFGGGGHTWAAGATASEPLDGLLAQVVAAMKEELEKDE